MEVGVPALVSHVSQIMRLEPGELIFTGAPAGVGPIRAGDVVSVNASQLGSMDVPVRASHQ